MQLVQLKPYTWSQSYLLSYRERERERMTFFWKNNPPQSEPYTIHTLLCHQVSMVTSFGVCGISAPWLIIHTKVLLHGIPECRYCSRKGLISYTNCKWMLSTQFITYSGTEAGTIWGDSLMVGQGCNSQQSVPVRDFCIQTVLITMLNSLNMMFFSWCLSVFTFYSFSSAHKRLLTLHNY